MLTDGDYRTVFEASPDALLIVDSRGVIRDLNSQALAMFGWSREELEGSPVERLVPDASRRRHREHRHRYAEAPRVRPMGQGLELSALRKDGTKIPVEISLSPGKLASGKGHVICAIRDITGWKRMRQLSRTLTMAAENERKSLSHELHDQFLQSLVALKIRVKLLAEESDDEERERARALIANEIHDAIRGVKRMIQGLLPPELDRESLSSALGSVFRDLHELYGFTVHAGVDQVDDQLDPVGILTLYRIVQEAVTNAARHARVGEAAVTIESLGDVVVAEIRDEGCGFELEGHVGLSFMYERAAMIGGHLTVKSSPGKGTMVRAVVPIPAAEHEQW